MGIPQHEGYVCRGDRSRKENLVEFGFRSPSALDKRPLTFEEFEGKRLIRLFMWASSRRDCELELSSQVVEQVIRPTGLVDLKYLYVPPKTRLMI